LSKNHKIIIHFAKNRTNSTLFPPKDYPWTVHYRGQCLPIKKLRIIGYTETEWHPTKIQNPRAYFSCYGLVRVLKGCAVVKSVKMPNRLRTQS
jgi:hypothetical protein